VRGNLGRPTSRANQRHRARSALIDAAAVLTRAGRVPTMIEVAVTALVSTATAYRYFPGVGDLLRAVALREVETWAEHLGSELPDDPERRMSVLVGVVSGAQLDNETLWRGVLSAGIDRGPTDSDAARDTYAKSVGQLRVALVRAVLAPLETSLGPERYRRLVLATTLVCGAEAMVAARDGCGLGPGEAADTIEWAARALLRAAISE